MKDYHIKEHAMQDDDARSDETNDIGQSIPLVQYKYISTNHDGVAILETASRIRKFTSKSDVLFVISEVQSNGRNYGGRIAVKHTKSCVEQNEKLGLIIIKIALESHVLSELMCKQ